MRSIACIAAATIIAAMISVWEVRAVVDTPPWGTPDPTLQVNCDPEVIGADQTVDLHAHVSDQEEDVTVDFYLNDVWVGQEDTDEDGDADFEFTPNDVLGASGQFKVVAKAPGYDDDDADLWVIEVAVNNVVRANSPDGVPPTASSGAIQITIDPSVPDGHAIKLQAVGSVGSATVTPDTITATGTFSVEGESKTSANAFLQVKAYIDDRDDELDASGGFSVCPHPVAIEFKYLKSDQGEYYDNLYHWGAKYLADYTTDSGDEGEAPNITVKELVTGGAAGTGWMNITLLADDNKFGWDSVAIAHVDIDNGQAAASAIQYTIFSCNICGIPQSDGAPAVPASGFNISIVGSKTDGAYFVNVKRTGVATGASGAGVADGVIHPDEVK